MQTELGYRPDPAGVFPSDAHRHVLGHLSLPDEPIGFTAQAVHERLGVLDSEDHASLLLEELEADGDAEQASGVWRMTEQGFEKLTGPIADEPPEGSDPAGAVVVVTGPPRLKDGAVPKSTVPSAPQPFPGG